MPTPESESGSRIDTPAGSSHDPEGTIDGESVSRRLSASQVLLFVDLLGVRARWHRGGRDAAEAVFKDFRNLVAASLKGYTAPDIAEGVIESDSAAVTCLNQSVALEVGRRLYRMAFDQTRDNPERRYWLRGVVVPRPSTLPLRHEGTFGGRLGMVTLTHYSPDLFDAIAIEKSGIKGMRLLIDRSLVTKDLCDCYRIQTDEFGFTPFKRLRDSYYPNRIAGTHMDFLWMATDRPDVRSEMEITMAKRLRLASFDAEEFAQAAATQVVFHQCSAMIASIAKYRFDRDSRKARQQRSAGESMAEFAERSLKNEPVLDVNFNAAEP